MLAKNLAQTPAGAIADDGSPDAPGSNEAGAHGRFWFGIFQNAECKRSTADGGAFRPNALEFGIQSESAGLRKAKAFLHRESLVRVTAVSSRATVEGSRESYLKVLATGISRLSHEMTESGIRTAKVFPSSLREDFAKQLCLITAAWPKRPAKTSY